MWTTNEIVWDTAKFGKIGWKPDTGEIYFFHDDLGSKVDKNMEFKHPMWTTTFRIVGQTLEASVWTKVELNKKEKAK